MRAIGEENGRDGAATVLKLSYPSLPCGVLLDIYVFVGDPLLPKKLLELFTIGSPRGAEDRQCWLRHVVSSCLAHRAIICRIRLDDF